MQKLIHKHMLCMHCNEHLYREKKAKQDYITDDRKQNVKKGYYLTLDIHKESKSYMKVSTFNKILLICLFCQCTNHDERNVKNNFVWIR